jgi:hypothetical protein
MLKRVSMSALVYEPGNELFTCIGSTTRRNRVVWRSDRECGIADRGELFLEIIASESTGMLYNGAGRSE